MLIRGTLPNPPDAGPLAVAPDVLYQPPCLLLPSSFACQPHGKADDLGPRYNYPSLGFYTTLVSRPRINILRQAKAVSKTVPTSETTTSRSSRCLVNTHPQTMPREAEDFPTIPGFAPVRSDDAPETAESPSVGTSVTVPADVLASLDMDDTLRSMILGDIESQNVLPLVYAELRGRLSGVLETNTELQ